MGGRGVNSFMYQNSPPEGLDMGKEEKQRHQIEIDEAMRLFTGKIIMIKLGYADGGGGGYIRWGGKAIFKDSKHLQRKKRIKKKKRKKVKKNRNKVFNNTFLDKEFKRKLADPKA